MLVPRAVRGTADVLREEACYRGGGRLAVAFRAYQR